MYRRNFVKYSENRQRSVILRRATQGMHGNGIVPCGEHVKGKGILRGTTCTSSSTKLSATGRLLDIKHICAMSIRPPSSLSNSDNPDKLT